MAQKAKHKGRQYERELKEKLQDHGLHVTDIAHNSGLEGQFDVDLLVWFDGSNPSHGWEDGRDDSMVQVEVKYRKSGVANLFKAHQMLADLPAKHVGEKGLNGGIVHWSGGFCSFGLETAKQIAMGWDAKAILSRSTEYQIGWSPGVQPEWPQEVYEKKGADLVAIRTSYKPWLFYAPSNVLPHIEE